MSSDTKEFILACSVCALSKSSHHAPAGLLCPLPIPHQPWLHIAVNFVTGLPYSEGNTTILTTVDRFSKEVHFVPLPKLPSDHQTVSVTCVQTASDWTSFPAKVPNSLPRCGRHLLGTGGFGQHIFWLPSTNQNSDRVGKSRSGGDSRMCGFMLTCLLVHPSEKDSNMLTTSGSVLPQVRSLSWSLMVSSLHCSPVRRWMWRYLWFRPTFLVPTGSGGRHGQH